MTPVAAAALSMLLRLTDEERRDVLERLPARLDLLRSTGGKPEEVDVKPGPALRADAEPADVTLTLEYLDHVDEDLGEYSGAGRTADRGAVIARLRELAERWLGDAP